MRYSRGVFVASLVLMQGSPLQADDPHPFGAFRCSAAEIATVQERAGSWTAPMPGKNDLAFTFADVNLKAGTARFVGPKDTFKVNAASGPGWVNFFHEFDFGPGVTTILSNADKSGNFLMIHSQVDAGSGHPIVTEFFGTCVGMK